MPRHERNSRRTAPWRALIAIFAASACCAQSDQRQKMAETDTPAAVTAVRFWSLGEATRIAIEITGEFEYETDRLTNPDRVYYDILGARNRVSRRRYHTVP